MIVADTSALITLATADTLQTVLTEFDVHTTETVIQELEETAEYNDIHGDAATETLNQKDSFTIHNTEDPGFESSRIDSGEASCITLIQEQEAEFLITDDLRALPELQTLVDAKVAISPIMLKALVKRGVLTSEEAVKRVEQLAEARDWLGRPIYRRAQRLFE
jgi:predicted nucleic acid-binding protein